MNNLLDQVSFQNGATAKNRAVVAAMTNSQSHADGTLSDAELRWLERRAAGGFGIVTTCAAHVARDGQGWPGELGVFDDAHVPGLARLSGAMHRHGALALAQIFHGGLRADPKVTGERPWSASATDDGPRAATTDDIERVIGQFGDAARRSHEAGMDGVEIHGAHGYLLTQFLSRVENRRTDEWGGSLENRARLLREVTRTVRARVPRSFVVGVRISPEDFGNAKGMDLDENLTVAKWLVDDGADFIHLSLWDVAKNSTKRPDRHALAEFRAALPPATKLMVAGKIWSRGDADRMFEMGADFVALARGAILNPDWPARAADPHWEPKRPPATAEELVERDVSPPFVEYLRKFKGLVAP